MQKFRRARWPTLAIFAFAVTASSAMGQMVPSTQPAPPVTPVIMPSTLPTNCLPGAPGQVSPCSSPTLAPMPPPSPVIVPGPSAPSTSPRTGLVNGFATGTSDGGEEKVLSYFQRGVSHVDTRKAFGFVLLPRSAVTEGEKKTQLQFCEIMLASLNYMSPDAAERSKVLVTYWPLSSSVDVFDIETAFYARNCDQLVDWYDHTLARSIAAKAGVTGLSGPMLITWPSKNADRVQDREPLIVDFAKADYRRATKTLQYWFRQLNTRPELWTSRIREGTIRAELADAINDTAGVVMAVLYGKWDSAESVT
ncbi:MAG: hypothetical protein ABL996_19605, partial [Micropepsaceae bacterium]